MTQLFVCTNHVDAILRQAHLKYLSIPLTCRVDADFRFMAASDLTNELQSPLNEQFLNDSFKLVDAVLTTLEDKNGEVQNMGVKWYSVSGYCLTVAYRHWYLS